MADDWESLTGWWLAQVADDPIYDSDVLPLLERLLPERSGPWLDLGCGDGRAMRRIAGKTLGCDLAFDLLAVGRRAAPVVQCRLPSLDWVKAGALDGAYAVLVAEHLADLDAMFVAAHRAVRIGGALVVVANHPAFTAAGSGPLVDASDGEVLWRWGPYFHSAEAPTEVGDRVVTFYHRPMDRWMNAAADAGWRLERMAERGLSEEAVLAQPGYAGQEELPRLVGWRWRR